MDTSSERCFSVEIKQKKEVADAHGSSPHGSNLYVSKFLHNPVWSICAVLANVGHLSSGAGSSGAAQSPCILPVVPASGVPAEREHKT